MNLIKKLVVLIAVAGTMGPAQAIAPTCDPRTLTPTVTKQTGFFAASGAAHAYSFADTPNFPDGWERQTLLASGSFSGRVSGLADGPAGGGHKFSAAEGPEEPPGWMMLLAGLATVGFIARRKASLAAG